MNKAREYLCGAVIPPFGEHESFEPKCRHCERALLNYRLREVGP